jgi:hypothetical protein
MTSSFCYSDSRRTLALCDSELYLEGIRIIGIKGENCYWDSWKCW